MFTSILNLEQGLTILNGVVCCMSALGLGLIIAWFYRRLGYCSHSFTVTLALLPALVQFVIMMVMVIWEPELPLSGPLVLFGFAHFQAAVRRYCSSFSPWQSDWQSAWAMSALRHL